MILGSCPKLVLHVRKLQQLLQMVCMPDSLTSHGPSLHLHHSSAGGAACEGAVLEASRAWPPH